MHGGDRSYDSADASHRALREIRQELERHPAIATVQGFPSGEFTQVVAQLSTNRLDLDAVDATLTVRWFAGETPDDRPQFSFHLSAGRGDFGWYHEPNPHVDGWGHYQKRSDSDAAYQYEPFEVSSTNPVWVVWEIMDRRSAELVSE
jgi:hypothetical protein